MLALAACTARGPDTSALLDPNSAGAATVHNATRKAFAQPAANIGVDGRARFFIGNAFFNSPWVVAPASATARDGLGPLFNARSCDACHNNDGRGRPPEREDERPVSLVIQFATPVPGPNNEPGSDPRYGGNLNPFAIGGVPAEGTVRIRHKEIHGQFADGENYTLLEPQYSFEELAYGELAHDNQFSPRVAPAVLGMGFIEAVPEKQILERNDPNDTNGDGISGKANYVWNHLTASKVIGRLGWKANQPDIAHQTAGAFSNEIGMSTSLRPQQNCTEVQTACQAAPTGGSPEVSDEIFRHIVDYQQMLGVPARREVESAQVRRGAALFVTSGCESCHRATFTTKRCRTNPG